MKLLVPGPDNREACLQQLWDKLRFTGLNEESLGHDFGRMSRGLQERSTGKVALAASDIGRQFLDQAVLERRRSSPEAAAIFLRKSFAFVYWSRELDTLARLDPEWEELAGDDLLMPFISWQALSTVCGAPWFALWVAPHLHNQFGYPGGEMPTMYYSLDRPAHRFMEVLQRCLVTGHWPAEEAFGDMAGYGRLLQACGEAGRWRDALVEFCDWRLANAYGYPEMGAAKRRRQSSLWSVLDAERIEQVLPVELLTLRFDYERATGRTLDLEAPHPMLQSPLMTLPFPSVEPMVHDTWIAQLEELRQASNPGHRPLRGRVEARFI